MMFETLFLLAAGFQYSEPKRDNIIILQDNRPPRAVTITYDASCQSGDVKVTYIPGHTTEEVGISRIEFNGDPVSEAQIEAVNAQLPGLSEIDNFSIYDCSIGKPEQAVTLFISYEDIDHVDQFSSILFIDGVLQPPEGLR